MPGTLLRTTYITSFIYMSQKTLPSFIFLYSTYHFLALNSLLIYLYCMLLLSLGQTLPEGSDMCLLWLLLDP